MTEIEREAEKILDDVWKCYISVQNGLEKLKPLLSTASRPPAGFVRDAEGVDRRVLGTFAMTKDGVICGNMFCNIWSIHRGTGKVYATTPYHAGVEGGYSTREAAEAAAGKERGE